MDLHHRKLAALIGHTSYTQQSWRAHPNAKWMMHSFQIIQFIEIIDLLIVLRNSVEICSPLG